MCVERGLVAAACGYHKVLEHEMRGQFGCGFDGRIGYYFIAFAIVENTDYAACTHGVPREVPHPLEGAFAVEIAAFQIEQFRAYGHNLADCRHCLHLLVGIFGDIECEVAAIALGPTFLPEVSGHFGHLVQCLLQGRTSFKYGFHYL